MAEAPSSRAEVFFTRDVQPPLVTEMARLAAVLRQVSDDLHDADPGVDDIAPLVALASELAEATGRLPRRQLAITPADVPDPEARTFNDCSPLTGETSPIAPPLRLRREGDLVVGVATFGRSFEGPPGHVHGGWIASGFDEVMGMAQALSSAPGMTARLDVGYRRPTPLGVELRFTGWVEEVRGRKIRTKATLHRDGELLADASGLFVSVDFEAMMARQAASAD